MKEKPTNIIRFPSAEAAANDASTPEHREDEYNARFVIGHGAAVVWHRLQYAVRLLVSIVLMALQGPVGVVCRFVGIWTGIAFCVLWFLPVPAALLWALGGACLALLVAPLLLDLLVYWIMPTK